MFRGTPCIFQVEKCRLMHNLLLSMVFFPCFWYITIVSFYNLQTVPFKNKSKYKCSLFGVKCLICTELQTMLYLYNKTRHSYIYMLPIAGQTAALIGLTFFCRHSWVVPVRYRLNKSFFSTGNAGPFS